MKHKIDMVVTYQSIDYGSDSDYYSEDEDQISNKMDFYLRNDDNFDV